MLAQRSQQFRAIQRRLLTRFKDKTPAPLANLDTLLDGTYRQVWSCTFQLTWSQCFVLVWGEGRGEFSRIAVYYNSKKKNAKMGRSRIVSCMGLRQLKFATPFCGDRQKVVILKSPVCLAVNTLPGRVTTGTALRHFSHAYVLRTQSKRSYDSKIVLCHLNFLTPDSAKSKIDTFSKITDWVKLNK